MLTSIPVSGPSQSRLTSWFPNTRVILVASTVTAAAACADAAHLPSAPDGNATPSAALAAAKTKVKAVRYAALALSSQSVCGLSKTGAAYCWGLNNYGQLGDGTTDLSAAQPRPVAGNHNFKQIAHNYTHGCGVVRSGGVLCWGSNEYGQLGIAAPLLSRVPIAAANGDDFSAVAVGAWHTCAIGRDPLGPRDGIGYCWGSNLGGQLGNNTLGGASSTPEQVWNYVPVFGPGGFPALHFYEIIAGASSTCGLSEGYDPITYIRTGAPALWTCWGSNYSGLFGDGKVLENPIVTVAALITLAPLSVKLQGYEDSHLCVIAADAANPFAGSRAYCAGLNVDGQLGDGTTDTRSIAVPVVGGSAFTSISAGSEHTCALDSAGRAFCWGANNLGQLGTGTTTPSTVPVAVATTLRFATVYAGNRYTCAITSPGDAYCWGRNEVGEVGDGTTIMRLVPTLVIEP